MTKKTKRSGALGLLVAAGLLVTASAVIVPGGAAEDEEPCERPVTYTANWADRSVRAERVRWGPSGDQRQTPNVRPPWQETEDVACDTIVSLEVNFDRDLSAPMPGPVLCAITFSNTVYEPTGDPAVRQRTCFVQTYVP